ncbi:uncharacterized protein LOC116160025 [Photinus pyralis]|uniref:uncharacterized protein LOC116160025 n=1 Tax=Photinus pyralis TaxID=7054 RepID=UPI0012675867|nr:uncharacterized protein LOC116160025 [Photinus pyralis]
MVIAGLPPVGITAKARGENWDVDSLMNGWHERWEKRESWTRTVIRDVREWTNRVYGEVVYYLTQFLSGHGENASYFHRFGKRPNPSCADCVNLDHPGHVVLECVRWHARRLVAEVEVGEHLTTETVVPIMLNTRKAGTPCKSW